MRNFVCRLSRVVELNDFVRERRNDEMIKEKPHAHTKYDDEMSDCCAELLRYTSTRAVEVERCSLPMC